MATMRSKLKSTDTKVTADVTSVVMGNLAARELDVGQHIAIGDCGLAWINSTKKSTKQEVAVLSLIKR